jgi:hypothetical protein
MKLTLQAGDQSRNGISGRFREQSANRAQSPGSRPFSLRHSIRAPASNLPVWPNSHRFLIRLNAVGQTRRLRVGLKQCGFDLT